MEIEKKEEEKVETPPQKKETTPEPSQKKTERSRLDKLRHTKASIDAQIAEEEARNGIIVEDEDDDKPVTRGDLKRIERDNAKKTALTMANDISDEDEREKVIEALQTRIVASGNPQRDLQDARNLVNSEKNAQIAAEAARKKGAAAPRSSGSGAPRKEEDDFIPSEQELAAAAMVGKKSPADIKAFVLKARAKENK